MPDISMCQNKECSVRLKCYRYMAMPSKYRQAYSEFSSSADDGCDGFITLYPAEQHLLDKYASEIGKENSSANLY